MKADGTLSRVERRAGLKYARATRNAWEPFVERRDAIAVAHARGGSTKNLVTAFMNNRYSVQVYGRDTEWGHVAQLVVRRHDGEPIRSWADMQRIKDEIAGPNRVAVEVYPAASDVMDQANLYHLWVLPEGFALPFSLNEEWR